MTDRKGKDGLRTARTKVGSLVAVCRKCAKRQGLSARALRGVLKAACGEGPGRVRVVETGCLGPCPKRLVAVATPDTLESGRVLLLDPAAGKASADALGRAMIAASEARAPLRASRNRA